MRLDVGRTRIECFIITRRLEENNWCWGESKFSELVVY